VYRAAAGHDTLVWIVVAVIGGGVILFPSLALLFRLTLTGRFQGHEKPEDQLEARGAPGVRPRLLARLAIAFLIAGLGLLNVADASWAHAVGVVSVAGFIVAGFLAVISDGLRSEEAAPSQGGL
jgi:cytochrome d ubiquinol oxidase subunit II